MWTARTWIRRAAVAVVGLCALVSAACGGSSASSTTSATATSGPTTHTLVATGLVGKRYCEVLLVHPTGSGLVATVYNTYPLNTCPEDTWDALDATAIAADNGVPYAELNGPRYWLMNSIAKVRSGGRGHQDVSGASP